MKFLLPEQPNLLFFSLDPSLHNERMEVGDSTFMLRMARSLGIALPYIVFHLCVNSANVHKVTPVSEPYH